MEYVEIIAIVFIAIITVVCCIKTMAKFIDYAPKTSLYLVGLISMSVLYGMLATLLIHVVDYVHLGYKGKFIDFTGIFYFVVFSLLSIVTCIVYMIYHHFKNDQR